MAKKAGRKNTRAADSGGAEGNGAPADSVVLGFAEDLGRILGTAQAKAEGWLNQRKEISNQLVQIRDTANRYLQQLTGGGANMAAAVARGRRRGRPPGSKNREAGNPPKRRGRRKMSAAARKAISEAQKKRWAKQKSKNA